MKQKLVFLIYLWPCASCCTLYGWLIRIISPFLATSPTPPNVRVKVYLKCKFHISKQQCQDFLNPKVQISILQKILSWTPPMCSARLTASNNRHAAYRANPTMLHLLPKFTVFACCNFMLCLLVVVSLVLAYCVCCVVVCTTHCFKSSAWLVPILPMQIPHCCTLLLLCYFACIISPFRHLNPPREDRLRVNVHLC